MKAKLRLILPLFLIAIFVIPLLVNCNGDPEPDPNGNDTLQPIQVITVDFISPNQSEIVTYGDTINFQVQSSYDDATLTSVEFLLDGNSIGNGDSTYAIAYALNDISGGQHKIKAVGNYSDGRVGTQMIFFNVVSDIEPTAYEYEVVNTYKHDKTAYTQGLEFFDGVLYESTGLEHGRSSLRRVDFHTGEVMQMVTIESKHFAEGITFWNDQIYQLTYTSQLCFVYDRNDLSKITQFTYAGQGWGLTHDTTFLIMSDGTPEIRFLNPDSFDEDHRITVYDNNGPVENINELEYVDGVIYANLYQTEIIAKIDPATGKVLGYIYMNGLLPPLEHKNVDVLNGIAYEPNTKKFYVTGKLWPSLFEVRFIESPETGMAFN